MDQAEKQAYENEVRRLRAELETAYKTIMAKDQRIQELEADIISLQGTNSIYPQ